jgi:guanosine-3',5'-bis(diphosphate) 3'-pyrophosphohydrolase
MSTLNDALEIAIVAHAGQVDKGGSPYIMHPIRVMLAMDTEEARIVAVLHDVLEDCPEDAWRVEEAGFSREVLEALNALTKRPGEPYGDFIVRVALNPLASKVKVADMRDNMDLSRIPNPTDKDRARVAKYARYVEVLAA